MAGKRDCFIELVKYFESLGIIVNIGKNKARGYQGLFCAKQNNEFRIDISKEIDKNNVISIMIHEFAHYVHYKYDLSLESLNFVFGEISDKEMEELLCITVEKVPKNEAKTLYLKKEETRNCIKSLSNKIRDRYPDFRLSTPFKLIEQSLNVPAKYLLKYDRVKYLNNIYSVETLKEDFSNLTDWQCAYISLKSKQRYMSRINAKINKLNKYYNTPTELWARFCELFFTEHDKAMQIAPVISKRFVDILGEGKINELSRVYEILEKI